MSEATQDLDFAGDNANAGFRLAHLEVFNWGTFDAKVWSLAPEGRNCLLTGDIGSGKSTLVDAVTTLLVPAQRITYNKAAGAGSRERSLRSYVLGYWKSERAESGLATRAVALRDATSYSVILGHFRNQGFDRDVTLAQVFWMQDGTGQPDRFYVLAARRLGIAADFGNFGTDLAQLKKRLKRQPDVQVFDTFPGYGAALQRQLGIRDPQALELFNQTVSMKSVDNITQFVREHMLEAFPVAERITHLIHHFDDLQQAHRAVVKARQRIAALTPLVADLDQYTERERQAGELRQCRAALAPWFASLKLKLLDKRLANLAAEAEQLAQRRQALMAERRDGQARRDTLKRTIADNGGDRLEHLKAEWQACGQRKHERQHRAEQYRKLAATLDLPDATSLEVFLANRSAIDALRERLANQQAERQNLANEAGAELHALTQQHQELAGEITSLKRRKSNIPGTMLAIRSALCAAIGSDEADLPFVGELLKVADNARGWEGAIERLLHSFGQSLLVEDRHYAKVAAVVDRTHLHGRLVYFRVRKRPGAPANTGPDSLVRKLTIRPDSSLYAWLEQELAQRFDYTCCDGLDAFGREARAITRAGQIKAPGGRHEKDDRHAIDDRTRYVLG